MFGTIQTWRRILNTDIIVKITTSFAGLVLMHGTRSHSLRSHERGVALLQEKLDRSGHLQYQTFNLP